MTAPEEEFTPDEHLAADERDLETSPEDAVEQATAADSRLRPVEIHRGLEVDEYDAIEQGQVVNNEDDEY